ncbi:MAG TPA: hydrogenase maturation nickel metallochaperone HypA [Bacteroidota bacterium]
MHELSIAQGILDAVRQTVPRCDWNNVGVVRVKVGDSAGVVCESLEFSFHALVADSTLAKARLEIERVPFRIRCHSCGQTFTNEAGVVVCLLCGSTDTEILSGTELEIREVELTETVREVS